MSQVTCETPDIVSSCDSGEGSKRNSLELDTESLGILRSVNKMITTLRFHEISSPGEMADSMTQSMASVSSLARDFSWEQLHTDTEREVMIVMMMLMMIYMMIVVIMTMAMSSLTRDFSWVQLGANS